MQREGGRTWWWSLHQLRGDWGEVRLSDVFPGKLAEGHAPHLCFDKWSQGIYSDPKVRTVTSWCGSRRTRRSGVWAGYRPLSSRGCAWRRTATLGTWSYTPPLHPPRDPHSPCPPLFCNPGDRYVGGTATEYHKYSGSSQSTRSKIPGVPRQSFGDWGQVWSQALTGRAERKPVGGSRALPAYEEGEATPGVHKPRATCRGREDPNPEGDIPVL